MQVAGRALAELRRAVAAESRPAELERWHAALAGDERAGARALAASCERRSEAIRREDARMHALFARRQELIAAGARHVAGVDEVGVGPLAGPVVAGAVVLPDRDHCSLPRLNDSKKLSPAARDELSSAIWDQALAIGIGEVSPAEIDELNILRATLEAMRRAVAMLALPLDHVLVDARIIPGVATRQTAIIGGDGKDASIAAASIVAKVHRDAIMMKFDSIYPGYGLAGHKGYGTEEHLAALRELGASPIHRRSFAPVAAVVGA